MKKTTLGNDEARVIKIDQKAICEILFDAIMKRTSDCFGLRREENPLRMMNFNPKTLEVTYVVCSFENRNRIDMDDLADRIEVTTESLLTKLDDAPKYVTVQLNNSSEIK